MFSEYCKKCDCKDYCLNRGRCLRDDIDEFNADDNLNEELELADDEGGLIDEDGNVDLLKIFNKNI